MKTADDIIKELHACDNPVTSSSLKTIAIAKLKQERDKYRKALDDIKLVHTWVEGSCTHCDYDDALEIINEALK